MNSSPEATRMMMWFRKEFGDGPADTVTEVAKTMAKRENEIVVSQRHIAKAIAGWIEATMHVLDDEVKKLVRFATELKAKLAAKQGD